MSYFNRPASFQISWNLALTCFQTSIISALMNDYGHTAVEASRRIDQAKDKQDDTIKNIIDTLIRQLTPATDLEDAKELMEAFNKEISRLQSQRDTPSVGPLIAFRDLLWKSLDWDLNGRKYEDWFSMSMDYLYHPLIREIDAEQNLGKFADAISSLDLTSYFEEMCGTEPRDREVILLKIHTMNEQIYALQNKAA